LFPNPSKGLSTISFSNDQNQSIAIDLIDLQGKKILNIVNRMVEVGNHDIELDVNNLQSGIYLVQVKTENGMFIHKMWVE
jgi:hypothetical protein